ncbi:MAG: dephospho-CoA kinase, partial [Clostridiales bacterium]|nr:dephospho-CoA kinase [Clostridiales bacterium]
MLVAITGGIGVGKSEVLKILAELSTNILSADKINAELLKTPEYIKEIAEIFPEAVSGGAVDKEILSSIIFSDEKKRKVLNGLAHPAIMRSIFERAKNMKG